MIIKYKAGHYCSKMIEEVLVERESESSVWVGGNRLAKMSTYDCYFDTWIQAKQHLVLKFQSKVDSARGRLNSALAELDRAKSLKRGNKK